MIIAWEHNWVSCIYVLTGWSILHEKRAGVVFYSLCEWLGTVSKKFTFTNKGFCFWKWKWKWKWKCGWLGMAWRVLSLKVEKLYTLFAVMILAKINKHSLENYLFLPTLLHSHQQNWKKVHVDAGGNATTLFYRKCKVLGVFGATSRAYTLHTMFYS